MNNVVGVRVGAYGTGKSPPANEQGNNKYLKVIVSDVDDGIEISSDGEAFTLSRGEIAVIPPFLPHVITGGSQGTVTVYIEQPLLPLKDVKIIEDVVNSGLRSATEQAAHFFQADNGARVLNALGELIVSYIAVQCERGGKSPVVTMLREDIERGMGDSAYSVEAFMRKLPLNYDYVRKLFKKETGLTPHEYLTAIRMERAGKILLSGVSNRYSAFTVGQIAEACGYAEPLYFSRVFKKYYGVSPTDYAKYKK